MKQFKINLIGRGCENPDSPQKYRATIIVVAVFIFLTSFGVGRLTYSATTSNPNNFKNAFSVFVNVGKLILSPDKKLAGEDEDRINILMLGMGGENHDGPLLTDTIVVASLKPSQNKVALLSIPRDLLVPIENFGWRKINAVNALTETKPGAGLEMSRKTVESLLGISIPYAIRVDFNGFEAFIDSVDGLDIFVDQKFTDSAYPTENYAYKTIAFEQGWQRMNGKTALEYVRSRHGNNGEGSDFARSRRQQKILTALKEKLLTVNLLTNPNMIRSLLAILQTNVTTNLQFGEIARLAKIGQQINRGDINSVVIDDSPNSPLKSSSYGGAYVLVPKNSDWSGLRNLAANIFEVATNMTATLPDVSMPPINQIIKRTTVEIRNIPATTSQTKIIASRLSKIGFDVVRISNASRDDYQDTTVYILNDSGRLAMSKIRDVFPEATVITKPTLQILNKFGLNKTTAGQNPDLLVILGRDQNS